MEEYITDDEFKTLVEDIQMKLQAGEVDECREMLTKLIEDAEHYEKYIDRTYIGEVKARKRTSKIAEINRMLSEMNIEQIENVYSYTSNEHDEPNHEAIALEAIMQLSKSRGEGRKE